jgi:hypothetical protein
MSSDRSQLVAESISEHLFDIRLALSVIADMDETFATSAQFQVNSLEILKSIEAYVRDTLRASSMIGEGIREYPQENGNVVYTLVFGDDPTRTRGLRGSSNIQISYVRIYPRG